MHSSRMRTGRSLTVCWSLLLGGGMSGLEGGVCSQEGGCLLPEGGVSGLGGVCSQGVSAPGGCVCSQGDICSWGCLLWGGVWCGGVYPSMHWGRPPSPLWTDRCLWKYYLGPTSLWPVKKIWTRFYSFYNISEGKIQLLHLCLTRFNNRNMVSNW